MRLNEKNVLITGGAKRVGAALAREFAGAGANLLLHCHHSRHEAEELLSSLPRAEHHRIFQADFAIPGEAQKLFAALPRVDLLLNNASRYEISPLENSEASADREQFEVNFWSPLALMKAFAAQKDLTEGAIVNFLDQAIAANSSRGGIYEISRRALAEATLELARDLGPRNLRINAIAPGPMIPPPQFLHDGMRKTLPTLPLRRKVELDDVCKTVRFLCENDSLTGEILYLDCGQHL